MPSASISNASTAVVVVQNPYAKKRPKLEMMTTTTTTTKTLTNEKPMTSRELLLQHLQLPPEEEVHVEDDVCNQEEGDRGESSSSCCLETQPKDALQGLPSQSTSAIDSMASHGPQAKEAAATAETAVTGVEATTPQFTPQWQNSSRPSVSQQLSFGSAEILTISEYLQHCEVFCRERKSVRLTGRLIHRIVHGATMISFVLNDPMESLKRKATTARTTAATTGNPRAVSKETQLYASTFTAGTSSTVRPQRPPSLGGRSSSSSNNNHTAKRSSLLSSSATTTSHRLVYKKTPGGLRTPAAAARTTSATGIISNMSRLKDTSVPQRQLHNPVETLVQALTTTISSSSSSGESIVDKSNSRGAAVWIIANPRHVMVQDCVVGDLVMVIGEVGCLGGSSSNNNNNSNQNGHDVTINTLPSVVCLEKEDATVLEQVRKATTAQQQQYYVAARICRNVNGTDMSLFTQALMTRRKFLRAIGNCSSSNSSSNSNNGVDDEADKTSMLRPGCGPPLPTTTK